VKSCFAVISALILSAYFASAQTKGGPSFDCGKARARDERLTCSNADLSALDRRLSDTYGRLRGTSQGYTSRQLQSSQQQWLKARSGICIAPRDWVSEFSKPIARDPVGCLTKLYHQRIKMLEDGSFTHSPVYWLADSKTAYSVVGDILLSETNIIMAGGEEFRLSLVKNIPQNGAMTGGFEQADHLSLLKVVDPRPVKLISDNAVCQTGDAPMAFSYVVAAYDKQHTGLSIAIFQGAGAPKWDKSYLDNTRDLCGTFGYKRAQP
jgi:uncharacterized protein YecT (DUF1311 family)